MKATITFLILLCISLSAHSQKVYMYNPNGTKVYYQKSDSLISVKFKKDIEKNEKLEIARLLNPNSESSVISNSNSVIIKTQKGNQTNFADLMKRNTVVYANPSLISEDGTLQFATDKVLVKIKDSYNLGIVLKKIGLTYVIYRRIGYDKNSYLILLNHGESLSIANKLYESGYFEYAQPSFTHFIKTMNPNYPDQWGFHNTGQSGGTAGIDIKAPEAWGITRGDGNIKVAVIDMGVDLSHPDLMANLLPGYDATEGCAGGFNGGCWGDDSHGTSCAGIIGAINNDKGTVGIASDCKIIPIRSFYSQIVNNTTLARSDTDWDIDAINHAWEQDGADVLSCSWGYFISSIPPGLSAEISDALNYGRNNLGCVIVFAAGNNNSSICWPANSNTGVIAVGAMSQCGERKRSNSTTIFLDKGVLPDPLGVSCDHEYSWGSNFGPELEFVAPGVKIATSDNHGAAGDNKSLGTDGDYTTQFGGTSAAAPLVAGIAALMLSVNPNLTNTMVRDILESTCTKVGPYNYSTGSPIRARAGTWNQDTGCGLVNAYAAVQNAYWRSAKISGPSVVCSSGADFSISNTCAGATILWDQSSNITRSSAQGANPCTFGSNSSGNGWIKAQVINCTGDTLILPQQVVWSGMPIGYFIGPSMPANYQEVNYTASFAGMSESQNYSWTVNPSTGTTLNANGNVANIVFYNPGQYQLGVQTLNECGSGSYTEIISVADSVSLMINPNPATSEVNLSIVSKSTKSIDENVEWALDVYSSGMMSKEKKTGLKGNWTTVNTSGWLNGIYLIRATYKGKQLTGKLVVRH